MEFDIQKQAHITIIKPKGRMDAVSAPEFEKQCSHCIEAGEVTLIADLSELDYISSAGFRSVLVSVKNLKKQQGELRFCGLTGMVKDVFEISGLSSILAIYDSLDDALKGQ